MCTRLKYDRVTNRFDIGLTMLVSALMLASSLATPAAAQDGKNVLVVANKASAESQKIAARYASGRGVPADQVLQLTTATTDDIERRQYDLEIELPIAEWISRTSAHDRIFYIVLSKGIPLRIRGTSGLNGTTASVDSELTLLYRKLLGLPSPPAGRVSNPYFHGDRPISEAQAFSHASFNVYLVTRLDGYTEEDAYRVIAQGLAPTPTGRFLLDRRADAANDRSGDGWLAQAAGRLSAAGFGDRVVLEPGKTVLADEPGVLGYYSWGSNDPAIRRRSLGLGFVAGSLAAMFVSTDGRTFQEPPSAWNVAAWLDPNTYFQNSPQSLAGDLIREGATGVAAHVAEPFLDAAIRPQILFPAYTAGLNLAESFYLAMPFLSWQTVVIGDPLCRPFSRAPLTSTHTAPALDNETELPVYFSARRLEALAGFGVRPDVAKLMLKANARLIQGDLGGAKNALEAVTVIEPGLNAAHFVLAGIYEQAGDFDLAIERYRRILSTVPGDVRSLNNLAYALATRKNTPADALPLARKARELASKDEVVVDLGYALIARRGTPAGSLPFGVPAYNLAALRAQIADTLGWIYHLLGDDNEGLRFLAQAVEGDPNHPLIHLHVALTEASRGRYAEAKAALDKALELDADLASSKDAADLRALLNGK
jgi:uncharacterized protein (TIGR03790 family)